MPPTSLWSRLLAAVACALAASGLAQSASDGASPFDGVGGLARNLIAETAADCLSNGACARRLADALTSSNLTSRNSTLGYQIRVVIKSDDSPDAVIQVLAAGLQIDKALIALVADATAVARRLSTRYTFLISVPAGRTPEALVDVIMNSPVLDVVSASVEEKASGLKIGVGWTFYADYNYLVAVVLADLDFKKNYDDSIRARFGPPILPIDNVHPLNRPRVITRELLSSEVISAKASKDLMVNHNVNALVGDFLSGSSEVMATYAVGAETPHMTLTIAETLADRKRYPYTFRAATSATLFYTFFWRYMLYFKFRSAVLLYTNDGFGMPVMLVKDLAQQQGRGNAIVAIPIFGNTPWDPEVTAGIAQKVKQVLTKLVCIASRNNAVDALHKLLVDYQLHAPYYQILSSAASTLATVHYRQLQGMHFVSGLADEEYATYRPYMEMKAKMTRADIEDHLEEYGITEWARFAPLPYLKSKMLSPAQFQSEADTLTQGFSMVQFTMLNLIYKAFNALLWEGKRPDEIRGAVLKNKLLALKGEGAGGPLEFDTNQDCNILRLAVIQFLNFTTVGSKLVPVYQRIVTGTFNLQITLPFTNLPLWPDGTFSMMPPLEYTKCHPGAYQQDDGSCQACPPGQISTTFDVTSCTKCQLGTVADNTSTVCVPCPAGSVAAERGLEACSLCQLGLYSDVQGSSECKLCRNGQYSLNKGSASCLSCTAPLTTKHIGSKTGDLCVCPAGTHLQSGACIPCGEGLECPIGASFANLPASSTLPKVDPEEVAYPLVKKGYFTLLADPTSVYKCLADAWCPGGSPETCAANTQGITCGSCQAGYFRSGDGSCLECSDALKTRGLVVGLPWLYAPFAMVMTRDESDVHMWYKATNIKGPLAYTVLFFLQTFGTYATFALTLPSAQSSFSSSLSVTLDFRNLVRPECAEFHEYSSNFYAGLLVPVYFGIIVCFTYLSTFCLRKCSPKAERKWYVMASFFGASYSSLFLSIATLTFSLFACYPHPNNKSSLRRASQVLCYESEWNALVGAGVVGILILLVGAFAIMALGLWAASRCYDRIWFRGLTKFLFVRFRVGYAYWSMVLLLKGLLISLTVVIFTEAQDQLMWIIGVLVFYIPLVAFLMPWRSRIINISDAFSHVSLAYIFSNGGFFVAESSLQQDHAANVCMAFAIATFAFFAFLGLYTLYLMFLPLWKPEKVSRETAKFAQEFCETLAAVGSDPEVVRHLYTVLPDYEQFIFRELQHILHREAGNKGAVSMSASSAALKVRVTLVSSSSNDMASKESQGRITVFI